MGEKYIKEAPQPLWLDGLRPLAQKCKNHVIFASFELKVQSTIGFMHVQLTIWKKQWVFLYFYATRRSPGHVHARAFVLGVEVQGAEKSDPHTGEMKR